MLKIAVIFITIFFTAGVFAQTLSEAEILYRCYGQLTSKRLKKNHPLLSQVKSGQISGADACESILMLGSLDSKGLLVTDSGEARSVLRSMTNLHMTFFENQSIADVNTSFTLVSKDIYDEQSSALHFTKALFFKNYGVDDILNAAKDLEGVRTNPLSKIRGPASNYLASAFTRKSAGSKKIKITPNFIRTGELRGLTDARAFNVPESTGSDVHGQDIRSSIGGGLIGTRAYLKRSAQAVNPTKNYDGALSMNRMWANTVLKDFLCKSLPAVRLADGQPYKNQDASASFRKTDGCIQCHATMDQLAAGGRNILSANLTRDSGTATNPQLRYHYQRTSDKPKGPLWPVKTDEDYYRRPPTGRLYYRSYTGDLVNQSFNSFDQLSAKILETDDYYSCIAKKYYKHFTGVDASLADINDPFSSLVLNSQDLFHRNLVIELGKELKQTKDSMKLIKSIMKSRVYQQKGYTLLEVN